MRALEDGETFIELPKLNVRTGSKHLGIGRFVCRFRKAGQDGQCPGRVASEEAGLGQPQHQVESLRMPVACFLKQRTRLARFADRGQEPCDLDGGLGRVGEHASELHGSGARRHEV